MLLELATEDAMELLELRLEEDGTMELWLELESIELEIVELDAPTIPNGAGCAAQVLRVIQLLLFS